jgi:leucyl-tRNA synthetase
MFLSAPDKTMEWDDKTVEGTYRFLVKVYRMLTEKKIVAKIIKNQESKAHRTIKEVTENIESFSYNLALISIMDFANYLNSEEEISRKAAETLLLLISPFTPHLAEELWAKLGNKGFISLEKWPVFDKKKIDIKLEAGEELYEKIRKDVIALQELTGLSKPNKIILILPDEWKYDFIIRFKDEFGKTRDIGVLIKTFSQKYKEHSKLIANLVPRFVKSPDKLPLTVLSQREEEEAFKACLEDLEKEFKTKFEIILEKDSKHEKARNAMPGKPAIVFE